MSERLRSVGLDVGTTTTQLIVSEIGVENRASSFAVPEMEIVERKILYKSPVRFTPLLDERHVDGQAIRRIVAAEYERAGISRDSVDTGAIIITGETSRKENARAVLDALSDFAGEFVVATAGPDLESVLAAKGAGAVDYSARTGRAVLHFDIGGGTSNWALIREGKILETGCLNVGGRLLKFDKSGKITYVSPVLHGLTELKVGDQAKEVQVEAVARMLAQVLEMAAGLREKTSLLDKLTTRELDRLPPTRRETLPENDAGGDRPVISFSGGVADCIESAHPWLEFGDMGPVLGRAIRDSRLCRGAYVLGSETIRATVIGAGCHSAQLSGSTVFCQNVKLPLKNLPVVEMGRQALQDGPGVLALPGIESPSYAQVKELAEEIAAAANGPVLVALEADMAKALGHALALRLGRDAEILCIDRVRLTEGSYLDVGLPIGPALPVVIKTLILEK